MDWPLKDLKKIHLNLLLFALPLYFKWGMVIIERQNPVRYFYFFKMEMMQYSGNSLKAAAELAAVLAAMLNTEGGTILLGAQLFILEFFFCKTIKSFLWFPLKFHGMINDSLHLCRARF